MSSDTWAGIYKIYIGPCAFLSVWTDGLALFVNTGLAHFTLCYLQVFNIDSLVQVQVILQIAKKDGLIYNLTFFMTRYSEYHMLL